MSEHDEHSGESKGHKSHGGGGHGGGGHGGGGGHEEHEGAPEWLISFADNVTLMMGFFVILLAITMSQAMAKSGGGQQSDVEGVPNEPPIGMVDAAIAIRQAFHNPVDPASTNPRELALVKRVLERAQDGYSMHAGVKGNKHDVQSVRLGEYHGPLAVIYFKDDEAQLSKEAEEPLAAAVSNYRGVRIVLEVRGHASAAESAKQADHGMNLSFNRALAVAKALAEKGLEWRQLRIVACGDNDRIKNVAYDRAGQRANACVEVVPTDIPLSSRIGNSPEEAEPKAESAPPAKPQHEHKH